MYDVYTKGKYQFTESSDLEHFKVIDHAISMISIRAMALSYRLPQKS